MSTLDLTADAHLVKHRMTKSLASFEDRFVARLDFAYAGRAVLVTETSTDVWVVTTFPGIPVIDGNDTWDQIFYGGETYTVTGSLATALTTAGYDVS